MLSPRRSGRRSTRSTSSSERSWLRCCRPGASPTSTTPTGSSSSPRGIRDRRGDGDAPQLLRAGRAGAVRRIETDDRLLAQDHPLHHDPGDGGPDRAPGSDHFRSVPAGRVRRSIDPAHGAGPPLLRCRPLGLLRHPDHRLGLLLPPGHEGADEGRDRRADRQRPLQPHSDVPTKARRTGARHLDRHRRERRNALGHPEKEDRETPGPELTVPWAGPPWPRSSCGGSSCWSACSTPGTRTAPSMRGSST